MFQNKTPEESSRAFFSHHALCTWRGKATAFRSLTFICDSEANKQKKNAHTIFFFLTLRGSHTEIIKEKRNDQKTDLEVRVQIDDMFLCLR